MNQLSKSAQVLVATGITAGAAAATAVNGAIIDLQNFEGCLFIIQLGTIVAGAVTSVKLQHGDAAALGDAADILGSGFTILDTDDDTVKIIDFRKPMKRYVRTVFSRATQNATFAIIAIPYGSQNCPTVQNSTTSPTAVKTLVSPASGAA